MAAMNAETLYKDFVRDLAADVFPPTSTAGFFGMGGEDLPKMQPILGVWILSLIHISEPTRPY